MFRARSDDGTLAQAATVEIVPAPETRHVRLVRTINVFNPAGGGNVDIELRFLHGASTCVIDVQTIAAGTSFAWTDIYVLDDVDKSLELAHTSGADTVDWCSHWGEEIPRLG